MGILLIDPPWFTRDGNIWHGVRSTTPPLGLLRVAAIVKRASPDSRVVVGGVHATALPGEVLRDPNVDYVIRGEGELPFFELVDGQPLEAIGGPSLLGHGSHQPIRHRIRRSANRPQHPQADRH